MIRRNATLTFGISAVTWIAACTSRPRPITEVPDSALGLVFATVLTESRGSGLQIGVYCLGIGTPPPPEWTYSDPRPSVIQLVKEEERLVRPYSECRIQRMVPVFLDSATGRPAMDIVVHQSVYLRGDTLMLWGNYVCGELCGGGGHVRVWRDSGHWKARFKLELIS